METKRLRKYAVLTAGVLLALLFAGCSRTPKDLEEKTVVLHLSSSNMRATDSSLSDEQHNVKSYRTITLLFWDKTGKQVSPFSRTFAKGSAEMDALTSPAGYAMSVSGLVEKVSAHCNFQGEPDESILLYQGANRFESVPYISEVAPLIVDPGDNSYTVSLSPKPFVARLAVYGKLEAPKNTKINKSAFSDITITGIYINNFIQKKSESTRLKLTMEDYDAATGVWNGHPEAMRNTSSSLSESMAKIVSQRPQSPDVYYLFPGATDETTEIDHVIVRLSYKRNNVQCTNRFLTLAGYQENTASNTKVPRFEAGYNYRLDLSSLGELFTTDDNGTPDDPTDPKPEMRYIPINGKIVVDPWNSVNLPVEL